MYKSPPAGRPYLGAAIGTSEFVHSYVESKVAMWMKELDYLATFAVSQPHAAHSAFTHGFSNKWSYLSRTIPGIGSLLQPLESSIRSSLIPALTGQPPPNDGLRDLFALPARLGGLALSNPVSSADDEYLASTKISDPLKCAILQQSFEYSDKIISLQCNAKSEIRKLKHEHYTQTASTLKLSLSSSLQRSMDLAQEKGSSSWLTSLPIHEFGFALHKIRVPFMMLWPFVTTGLLSTPPLPVPADKIFQLNMPSPVLKVASQSHVTMRSETLPHISLQKSVMMSV